MNIKIQMIPLLPPKGQTRSQVFLLGGAIQGGGGPNETGGASLYYERFDKHGYFSNCGTSTLIFLAKRQRYHYLLEGGCA